MNGKQVLLAVLASAEGRLLTPAQLQKSVFLISENVPDIVTRGQKFNFVPYDYGPFDKYVYECASDLKAEMLAILVRS